MGFFDWVRNRGQEAPGQAKEQENVRPATAKPAHAYDAAQEKASTPPVTSLKPEQLAEAKSIGAEMMPQSAPAPTPAPTPTPAPATSSGDATDNQQPQQQLLAGQGRGAPDLSPTSAQMGMKEAELPVRPAETPSPTQPAARPTRSMSPDL